MRLPCAGVVHLSKMLLKLLSENDTGIFFKITLSLRKGQGWEGFHGSASGSSSIEPTIDNYFGFSPCRQGSRSVCNRLAPSRSPGCRGSRHHNLSNPRRTCTCRLRCCAQRWRLGIRQRSKTRCWRKRCRLFFCQLFSLKLWSAITAIHLQHSCNTDSKMTRSMMRFQSCCVVCLNLPKGA